MPEPSTTITIQLNGEPYTTERGARLAVLLERLNVRRGSVAIELNRAIVAKAEYENVVLEEGDHLEVINFVGGG